MRAGFGSSPASRPWAPVALTLGLHLLLVLAWRTGAPGERVSEPPQRASTFVLVQPPARPKPAPRPAPRLPARPGRLPATIHIPVAPRPPPTPPAVTEAAALPQAAPAAGAALPGDLLASSRAMAGGIDRALRHGSSPITAEPDRKWERFADAVAGARIDRSRNVTLSSYTQADGVIVYRRTMGGKNSCYRIGSVGGLVTGFGNADLHGATVTPCPADARWTRH